MSERDIRAALSEICSDLERKHRRGVLRPGAKAALYPMALGAAALAAIACSAEPLLAEGGMDPTTTPTGGTGGSGGGPLEGGTGGIGGMHGNGGAGGQGADCPGCSNAGSGGMPGGAGGAGGETGGAGGG